ncbi:hypothetical protein B484DRAFT_440091, partial [Ochromonadaceae sp. CCMP2298]
TGDANYYGDGGLAVNAALRKPQHAMGGSDGKIYISEKDNDVIRVVDSSGYISTFAGTNSRGYSGDGGLATSAKIERPATIYVDNANKKLYFTWGRHVRVYRGWGSRYECPAQKAEGALAGSQQQHLHRHQRLVCCA